MVPEIDKMLKLLLPVVYLSSSLLGLYKMKTAEVGFNFGYLLGIGAYAGSFFIWLFLVRLYPLSVAFPLAAGALMVGTQLIGAFLLGEQLGATKALGIALLLAGLVVLAYSQTGGQRG